MDRLTVSQIQAFKRLNETFRLPGDEVHLFGMSVAADHVLCLNAP